MQPGSDVRSSRTTRVNGGGDDRLADIERRVQDTRRALDPDGMLENQWVRIGIAVGVGFIAGYAGTSAPVKTGARLLLTAGARYLIKDAFDRALAR